MEKQRKHFTAADKVKLLRRHLVEKVPVSQVCEDAGIQPTQFYRWQQIFFENGTAAFERQSKSETSAREQRISFLESKLHRKDEVLSELMEEHVALKKVLGSIEGDLGATRHTRCDHGFRKRMVRKDGHRPGPVHRLAGHRQEQVLQLARPLRQGE